MLDNQANKKEEAKKSSSRKRSSSGHERQDSLEEEEGGAKRRKVTKKEKIHHSEKTAESANDEMSQMKGVCVLPAWNSLIQLITFPDSPDAGDGERAYEAT